jgi:HEAT repeat protein
MRERGSISERVKGAGMGTIDAGTTHRVRTGANPVTTSLIAALSADEADVREGARRALVSVGRNAVEPLRHLLKSPERQLRWEAVKALGEIKGERAVDALVLSLSDEKRDIRWLAAQGLISCGETALIPLLEELIAHADSAWVRDGAAHVLRSSLDKPPFCIASPVLDALSNEASTFEVPAIAYEVLRSIRARRWMGRGISRH